MVRILRRQKSAYALSFVILILGLTALLITFWKVWPTISSTENPFATFWTLIWNEQLGSLAGIEFKLAYLVISGIVLIIFGASVLALSRQWLPLPGNIAMFQCPFCNKKWRATGDKALVHCPHCKQLVHPKIVEK
jgi:uncharacterized Zn-finger protein